MKLALGLMSLTYNVSDGLTYNDTYIRDGKVNGPDLSCIRMQYHQEACALDEVTIETVAHAYGEMNLAAEFRGYDDIAEVLNSRHNYGFYWRQTRNRQQFAYRFKEYNPDDKEKVYPYLTNRTCSPRHLVASHTMRSALMIKIRKPSPT